MQVEWMTARAGERFAVRVPAEATDGTYSLVELISSPGDGTPLHVHEKEDELIFVLEGEITAERGDETLIAKANETLYLPRRVPHAWANRGEIPLRMLVIVTPGGVEEALRIIARGGEVDFVELEKMFQVKVLGPSRL